MVLLAVHGLAVKCQPQGWAAERARNPVSFTTATSAVGVVPIASSDQNYWFLYVIRLMNTTTNEAGIWGVGLAYWTKEVLEPAPNGRLLIKTTKQGYSQQFVVDLSPQETLDGITSTTDPNGDTWYLRLGVAATGLTREQIHDVVRGKVRLWLGEREFSVRNMRPFRKIEDDIIDDDRFARLCMEPPERKRPFLPRVPSVPRRPAPATTQPESEPSTPKPPAEVTHSIELVDGRFLVGRLIGDGEADPVEFIVCVGTVEQSFEFAQAEIVAITESKATP
ncbi:MAG: hypothetical protein AAFN41_08880 [Planctomycetota bacterium]